MTSSCESYFGKKRRWCLTWDALGRPESLGVGRAALNISVHF